MNKYKIFILVVLAVVCGICFFIFNQKIRVSVIIPVYNSEKYLETCLDSLEKQTLDGIEFVVINDGSTDKSYEIMQRYAKKDKRFKIYSKENEGVGKARNMGLKLAKGEYVGYLDSDDYVSKNYFAELYKVAKKYDADVSVVSSFFRFKDNYFQSSKTLADKFVKQNVYFVDDISFEVGNLGQQWDKIYKKSFLNRYNIKSYDERLWFEDEWFSSMVALYANKIAFTDKGDYYYRYNPTGITQSLRLNKNVFEKGLVLYQKLIDNVNLMNTNQEKKKEIIGKINKKIEWYKATYNKNNHLYQN